MAAGLGQERRWGRLRAVAELLLVIGAVLGVWALFFADLSEGQRAGVQLYVWVLVARNAVTGYLRSRREFRSSTSASESSGGPSVP